MPVRPPHTALLVSAGAVHRWVALGDRIQHSRFGDGVVDQIAGAHKVRVFFSGGPRILVHQK